MRIVALSDTHTLQHKVPIPDGDVLIMAGDSTGRGNWEEFIAVGKWFKELKSRFTHRIIIAGNHDFGFQFNANSILKNHFDEDVIYLQDEEVTISGIKFYGSPWTRVFYNWAFMKLENELAFEWAKIPDDVDVLITHSPPYGILDKNGEGQHCGSTTLYDRVKQLPQLKHHIFGHIHESAGIEKIDDVTFHNVCSLNGMYRYQNPPQIIEI